MNNYIVINIFLTILALIINSWMSIPHKLKFRILQAALFSWLIPYNLFQIQINQPTLQSLPRTIQDVNNQINTILPTVYSEGLINLNHIIIILFTLGLLKFLHDIMYTLNTTSKLYRKSKPYKTYSNVLQVSNIDTAFVSGYFKPIIWIDKNLSRSKSISSIIAHEQQHISNNDQFWLLYITLIHRLFWFNPMIWFLNNQIRKSIELRCDEACKEQLGNKYITDLAKIFLKQKKCHYSVLINFFGCKPSFQVNRIHQLQKENKMTNFKRVKLTFITSILISLVFLTLSKAVNSNVNSDNLSNVSINWKWIHVNGEISNSSELKSELVLTHETWHEYTLDDDYIIKLKIKELQNKSKKTYNKKQIFLETEITRNSKPISPIYNPQFVYEMNEWNVFRVTDLEYQNTTFEFNFKFHN